MQPIRVLFVCSKRGARATIAAILARQLGGPDIEAETASYDPGPIRGVPLDLITELAGEAPPVPEMVFERFQRDERYDHVVTMCSASSVVVCPLFNSGIDALFSKKATRHSWAVPDFRGVDADGARAITEGIRTRVATLLAEVAGWDHKVA